MKVEFKDTPKAGIVPSINKNTLKNNNNNVAFQGKFSSADIGKKIDSYMPVTVKTAKKLSSGLGEVQNTMINAIGTGVIAPIFIKFNPLSKSDEDTRTYAAWRQPVSAVLAILTNVYLTVKPFDKAMENMVNKGVLDDDYNRTAFQDEKFIAKELKKQHPEYSEQQISQKAKAIVEEQSRKLLNDIRENETIKISRYNQKGLFDVNKGLFQGAVKGAIQKLIDGEIGEKKRLQEEKQVYRIRRREFYRTHNKETLDYVTEVEKILNESDLSKVKSGLKAKIKELKGSKDCAELKLITQEILGLAKGNIPKEDEKAFIEAMLEKLHKVKKTAINYGPDKMADKAAVEAAIKSELSSRITEIDNTLNFYKRVQQAINDGKTVKDIERMFEAEVGKNARLKRKNIIFAKRVADTFKDNIKGSIKCNKQVCGIIIGLIAAPFSCYLLNAVYPVFMDTFFPNLSNKKGKGKNKLIEQAPVKGKEVNNG